MNTDSDRRKKKNENVYKLEEEAGCIFLYVELFDQSMGISVLKLDFVLH